eukprot:2232370-Alexandrium_andersonii.AAC.1
MASRRTSLPRGASRSACTATISASPFGSSPKACANVREAWAPLPGPDDANNSLAVALRAGSASPRARASNVSTRRVR